MAHRPPVIVPAAELSEKIIPASATKDRLEIATEALRQICRVRASLIDARWDYVRHRVPVLDDRSRDVKGTYQENEPEVAVGGFPLRQLDQPPCAARLFDLVEGLR